MEEAVEKYLGNEDCWRSGFADAGFVAATRVLASLRESLGG